MTTTTADPLADFTYMVQHNPNCPMPYEVRTSGSAGKVEAHNPKNVVTYGLTLESAVANMVQYLKERDEIRSQRSGCIWPNCDCSQPRYCRGKRPASQGT